MRLSLRLILFLVVGITLVTFFISRNQVRSEKSGLRADLQRRAEVLAESLQEIVEPALQINSQRQPQLRRIVERYANKQQLAGVVVYDEQGRVLAESSTLVTRLTPPAVPLDELKSSPLGIGKFLTLGGRPMHAYYMPLHRDGNFAGVLAIFHDADYIEAQSDRIWRDTVWHVVAQVLLVVLITVLIIRWTVILPISRTAKWMKDIRVGRAGPRPKLPDDFLAPFSQEVVNLAKSLSEARASAEEEARLRETGESMWTAERLRVSIQSRPFGSLFVVSNREPYMHVQRGKNIEALVPASGLVTALEPILRACDGTWIAFGSGDADKVTVDEHDRLRVPPDNPEYTLRRVWLNKDEEQGYYYGFSNEGLWPLCHIAHTRPIFRASDWQSYQDANRKFADAVLAEMQGIDHALLLVQDYHFALLPKMVKQARPDVRVAIFWHIPWPNPEAFRICPWQRELLDGLLGADLVGFHIQAHCNNFLETVDAALESRIEWERFAVKRNNHTTLVRPFPISVDFRESQSEPGVSSVSPYELRAALLKNLDIKASFLGVGVDRIDYTKGIIERFWGIDRFLEKYPGYRRQFTFVQIGAPSRTNIPRYDDLVHEVEAVANRINGRYQTSDWKPIVLLTRHHDHHEIRPYYRAADLCMVTSLHDGMNLVAKEFVASREDEGGALILSQFTGATRELRDAIIVNPYDTEQLADAIELALEMSPEDRRERMKRMRRIVKEHNVYRWAGNLISELSEIRINEPEPALRNES